MAIIQKKKLWEMSPQELKENLQKLKAELSKEESAIASGTRPENPGRIKETRRTIARILTIQKEKAKRKPIEKKETKTKEVDAKK